MKLLKGLITIFVVWIIGIQFVRLLKVELKFEGVVIQYVHPIDSVLKKDTLDLSVKHFGEHVVGQTISVYFVKNIDGSLRDSVAWPSLPIEDSLTLQKISDCRAIFINAEIIDVIR